MGGALAKRHRGRNVAGILLLDKPAGITSNAALQRVKRLYDAAKAGHTGSLDPLATGMLPICLGAATKVSAYLLDARKTYRVAARLGEATDTGDADGRLTARKAVPPLDAPGFDAVLARFRGRIRQTPPMYSALKHEGRRLYELARRGIDVERKPREVTIEALTLERLDPPDCTLLVTCSKGTYIRVLVEDIAVQAGTLGHVTALRRLSVEPFDAVPMVTFEQLEVLAAAGLERLDGALLPLDEALAAWPRVDLTADAALVLRHGQAVAAEAAWPLGRVRIYEGGGRFVGLGEVLAHGELVPRRVFSA
jgi:tRNA pseudouridine55 synthase